MTGQELVRSSLDRGYKSLTGKQFAWFRSLAENDSTIDVDAEGAGRYTATFEEANILFTVNSIYPYEFARITTDKLAAMPKSN